jgi:hypothetical protein
VDKTLQYSISAYLFEDAGNEQKLNFLNINKFNIFVENRIALIYINIFS